MKHLIYIEYYETAFYFGQLANVVGKGTTLIREKQSYKKLVKLEYTIIYTNPQTICELLNDFLVNQAQVTNY